MKKNIIIGLSLIIIISAMILVIISMKTDNNNTIIYTEDEIKFKNEYEKYNGMDSDDNSLLKSIEINSDNNVKYINNSELLSVLTEGTNIIYFGWADNNWCRTVVPILTQLIRYNNIETLYYYDFKSLKDGYLNNDEESVNLYNEILNIIGNDINTYYDDTDSKKIQAPTVVFIKNGEYIGLHSMTVDTQENPSDELNSEEISQLKQKYQNYIDVINSNVCEEKTAC